MALTLGYERFVRESTDANGNTVLVGAAGTQYVTHTAAYDEAASRLRQADFGTMIVDWSAPTIVANGVPASGPAGLVTTDLAPIKSSYAVRLVGDPSTRASVTHAISAQNSGIGFRGIAFWAKVKGRSSAMQMTQLYLGATAGPYTGKAIALSVGIPSDGKWHLIFIPRGAFSILGGFAYGTDPIVSIGIRDRDNPTIGYPKMATNAEELQLGPVYINPFSRPKFLIRFDDSLDDCIVDSATFTADGVTQAWNGYSLLNQYGFGGKGSCFHLTRRIGTSNSVQTFLTAAQLATLAGYGWSHCVQSHQDPVDVNNNGLLLMGPNGYTAKTISSVDTAANTITASAAHGIVSGTVYFGYPITFSGTDLPAPLVVGTIYWARYSSATAFTIHPTESDAIANTNTIDLTTAGTAANFTYRYGYSANDSTLMQADLQNAKNVLDALGYTDTSSIYAPNQGAIDANVMAATAAVGIDVVLGIGRTGATYLTPSVRHLHMETSGASGTTGHVIGPDLTVPSAIQTDGTPTAADVETYVDSVIAAGGIGSNYHHAITASNGPVLAAYLARLRLRESEGACDVITAKELRYYIAEARTLSVGVVY